MPLSLWCPGCQPRRIIIIDPLPAVGWKNELSTEKNLNSNFMLSQANTNIILTWREIGRKNTNTWEIRKFGGCHLGNQKN